MDGDYCVEWVLETLKGLGAQTSKTSKTSKTSQTPRVLLSPDVIDKMSFLGITLGITSGITLDGVLKAPGFKTRDYMFKPVEVMESLGLGERRGEWYVVHGYTKHLNAVIQKVGRLEDIGQFQYRVYSDSEPPAKRQRLVPVPVPVYSIDLNKDLNSTVYYDPVEFVHEIRTLLEGTEFTEYESDGYHCFETECTECIKGKGIRVVPTSDGYLLESTCISLKLSKNEPKHIGSIGEDVHFWYYAEVLEGYEVQNGMLVKEWDTTWASWNRGVQ